MIQPMGANAPELLRSCLVGCGLMDLDIVACACCSARRSRLLKASLAWAGDVRLDSNLLRLGIPKIKRSYGGQGFSRVAFR